MPPREDRLDQLLFKLEFFKDWLKQFGGSDPSGAQLLFAIRRLSDHLEELVLVIREEVTDAPH